MLFVWLRHYAVLISLLTVLGAAGGGLYVKVFPPGQEAWTIVLQTGGGIGPLQLGSVSQAVFNSAATYQDVLQKYRPGESPQRFLSHDVQLLPIPQSNALIVIGRGRTLEDAARLSSAMADSLVHAFASKNISRFTFFKPQPAVGPIHASLTTVVLVAAGAGLWLGVAIAIVHYRVRRPLLALSRAVSIVEPRRVVILSTAKPYPLAPRALWRNDRTTWSSLRRLGSGRRDGLVPELHALGASERTERRLARRLRGALGIDRSHIGTEPEWTVFVCTPATGEVDLALARRISGGDSEDVDLIWVR